MGAWSVMFRRMPELVPEGVDFRYVGRPPRAAPSEGYPAAHRLEQERIVLTAHVQEPGANDNASGVATLVEMARALRLGIASGQIPPPKRTLTSHVASPTGSTACLSATKRPVGLSFMAKKANGRSSSSLLSHGIATRHLMRTSDAPSADERAGVGQRER